jgi:hypothetical protein
MNDAIEAGGMFGMDGKLPCALCRLACVQMSHLSECAGPARTPLRAWLDRCSWLPVEVEHDTARRLGPYGWR